MAAYSASTSHKSTGSQRNTASAMQIAGATGALTPALPRLASARADPPDCRRDHHQPAHHPHHPGDPAGRRPKAPPASAGPADLHNRQLMPATSGGRQPSWPRTAACRSSRSVRSPVCLNSIPQPPRSADIACDSIVELLGKAARAGDRDVPARRPGERGPHLEVSLKSLPDPGIVDVPAQRRSPVKRRLTGCPRRAATGGCLPRTREETS
jgi:hypothetical protein